MGIYEKLSRQIILQDVLSVHCILLFSQLVDQGVLVKVYHIVGDQGALLHVALHHCVLVDQAERYIALLGRFLLCVSVQMEPCVV